MPYRELSMIEVREVLRRYVGGAGLRAIARGTGLDRKTAAKYIAAGSGCGLRPGGAPPTDDQIATVLAHLQGPMPGRPGTTHEVLRPHPVRCLSKRNRPPGFFPSGATAVAPLAGC